MRFRASITGLSPPHTPSTPVPVSSLHKSIAGRYWHVRVADRPITARCRFIKNASWGSVPTDRSKAGFVLQFFFVRACVCGFICGICFDLICSSSLLLKDFWCLGMGVLRNFGISWVSSHILLILINSRVGSSTAFSTVINQLGPLIEVKIRRSSNSSPFPPCIFRKLEIGIFISSRLNYGPYPLKRQSQLLSSALSSVGYFKRYFCKQCGSTLFACMQK